MSNGSQSEADRCLSIAQSLLRSRDLHGCRTFVLRALGSNHMIKDPTGILAVAETLISGDVMVNNQRDWYGVLQLPRLTPDTDLISSHYRRLSSLLHPLSNSSPYADQAFNLVSEAYSVLSTSSKKSLFDHELSLLLGNTKQPSTFWTTCPYCFYLYEYPAIYQDCALRCQNCQRAFQAVSVPPPPAAAGAEGGSDSYFCCWAFFPLRFSSAPTAENVKKSTGWNPFSAMFACTTPLDENGGRYSSGLGNDLRPENTSTAAGGGSVSDIYGGGDERKRKMGREGWRSSGGKRRRGGGCGESGDGMICNGNEGVVNDASTRPELVEVKKEVMSEFVGNESVKLDLNVEFSNEAEDIRKRADDGRGEEENEFFEGLDEFLSNLPILSVSRNESGKGGE